MFLPDSIWMGSEGTLEQLSTSLWDTEALYSRPHFRLGTLQLVVVELQLRGTSTPSHIVAVKEFIGDAHCHEIRASLEVQSREAVTSSGAQAAGRKRGSKMKYADLNYKTITQLPWS